MNSLHNELGFMLKLQKESLEKALENAEYARLHSAISQAIQNSLDIIKKSAVDNIGGGRKQAMAERGIATQINDTGLKGVVLLRSTRGNWWSAKTDHKCLWFDSGTEKRYQKGKKKYWAANSNKKQGGARLHREKGRCVGKITGNSFFSNAVKDHLDDAYNAIEKAIENQLNRQQ